MSIISNASIKVQLSLIAILAIIGFLTVGTIYFNGSNELARFQQSQIKTVDNFSNVNVLQFDFLLERRNEKDFFLRLDEKYAKKHADVANETISLMKQMSADIQDSENQQLLAEVESGFLTYVDQFNMVADLRRQIGLSEKEGLRSELRSAVHKVEEELKKFDLSPKNSSIFC